MLSELSENFFRANISGYTVCQKYNSKGFSVDHLRGNNFCQRFDLTLLILIITYNDYNLKSA